MTELRKTQDLRPLTFQEKALPSSRERDDNYTSIVVRSYTSLAYNRLQAWHPVDPAEALCSAPEHRDMGGQELCNNAGWPNGRLFGARFAL